jgi:hypothetical protein
MVETGGGTGIPSIFVLVPFLVFGLGIVFVFMAYSDKRGPKDPGRKFRTRANHPLRHVQVALNADRKKARDKAREAAREKAGDATTGENGPKPEPPKPKQRPTWLRRV